MALINDEIVIMIKKYQRELETGKVSKKVIFYIDYLKKRIDKLELENMEFLEVIGNIKNEKN